MRITRGDILCAAAAVSFSPAPCARAADEPLVTSKVELTFAFGSSEPKRVTLGLFGDLMPSRVALFEGLCAGSIDGMTYAGSLIPRVERDRKIVAGQLSGGVAITQERFIDSTGYVRSSPVSKAARYFDAAESNELSHDRGGLVSVPRNGGAFEFILTPCANPLLDAEYVVIGKIIDDPQSALAMLNELPTRVISASDKFSAEASLYALRFGGAAGLGLVAARALGRRAGLAGLAIGGMGSSLIGGDPRADIERLGLSYKPLLKTRIISTRLVR